MEANVGNLHSVEIQNVFVNMKESIQIVKQNVEGKQIAKESLHIVTRENASVSKAECTQIVNNVRKEKIANMIIHSVNGKNASVSLVEYTQNAKNVIQKAIAGRARMRNVKRVGVFVWLVEDTQIVKNENAKVKEIVKVMQSVKGENATVRMEEYTQTVEDVQVKSIVKQIKCVKLKKENV